MSNIRALKYLELLLRLGCTLNVENEFYFATRYKFCRWWLSKLSKCKKTSGFRPIPRWEERLRHLVSQPPVGEYCSLVGVPPSTTTVRIRMKTLE